MRCVRSREVCRPLLPGRHVLLRRLAPLAFARTDTRRHAQFAEALAQRGGGALLSKLVTDCLNISPSNSDGWLAAALHWKHDLACMSELLEKVTAGDPQCVHAHLLEAELHLERRQYAAALFSARNAHALHRSVRSYRSRSDAQAPPLHPLTRCCSALVKTYLGQSRSKDALVVAKVPHATAGCHAPLLFPHPALSLGIDGEPAAQCSCSCRHGAHSLSAASVSA